MKNRLFQTCIIIFMLHLAACSHTISNKIEQAITDYQKKSNPGYTSIRIDSITYSLEDSTIYYNHFLKLLGGRSESFSKMAKLRANLAQSDMNDFLSRTNNTQERNTSDVDKSLEALKQNERDWDATNDSMDLILGAVHETDTLKKVFYNVRFILTTVSENKKNVLITNAILNKEDFKVVFVEE